MFVNVIDEQLKNELCNKGYELITSYATDGKTIWIFDESSIEFVIKEHDDFNERAFLSRGLIMRYD